MNNPSVSPRSQADSAVASCCVRIVHVGFKASVIGLITMLAIGSSGVFVGTIVVFTAFLSLPGLILSSIALFGNPSRLAALGVALGLFGTLNLPTLVVILTR